MNPLRRLRKKLAARTAKREQARRRYRRTGAGGLEARRHQKAVLKLRLMIRNIKRKPRSTSRKGALFIATFEGFCPVPVDIGDGVTTIGIGHVIHQGPPTTADHRARWVKGQKTPGRLTYNEAITLFMADLAERFDPEVRKLFNSPLHGLFAPWRFDALVSVAFNLGTGAIKPGTPGFETLGRAINRRSLKQIADALPLYSNPGSIFHQGLLRRRRCEARLLRTGNYSTVI